MDEAGEAIVANEANEADEAIVTNKANNSDDANGTAETDDVTAKADELKTNKKTRPTRLMKQMWPTRLLWPTRPL